MKSKAGILAAVITAISTFGMILWVTWEQNDRVDLRYKLVTVTDPDGKQRTVLRKRW